MIDASGLTTVCYTITCFLGMFAEYLVINIMLCRLCFVKYLVININVGLRAFARLTGLVPLLVLPVSCLCSSYRFRASLLVHRVMSHASLIRADSTHLCTFPYHLRHSRCPPHFPFFVCSFCALSCLAMSLNNFHFTNLSIIVILEEPVTRVLGSGIGRRSGVGHVASAIEMIALGGHVRA